MSDIFILVWLIGIVVSLHPIYASICRSIAREEISKGHRLNPGDVIVPAAIATFCSLFWVLTIPFFASFLLHRRRTFKAEEELENFSSRARQQRATTLLREQAAIEVESSLGVEMVVVPGMFKNNYETELMPLVEAREKYGHRASAFEKVTSFKPPRHYG